MVQVFTFICKLLAACQTTRKITNEMLYNTTNQKLWSQIVKKRRLSFFGYMARLPDDAPANLALDEFRNTKAKKFRGDQTLT